MFSNEAHIAHAKAKQIEHWKLISAADFGSAYAQKVRAIGQAHARLGLEPRWYIGGYALITEELLTSLIVEQWPGLLQRSQGRAAAMAEAVTAILKAVMLDMDLAISTYLEALEAQRLSEEQARLEAEKHQSDALEVLTAALARLAQGDLGIRIDQQLASNFDKLKSDFNGTVAQLENAMVTILKSANAISSGTQEISAAADDLSRRTEKQAASLEETAAALEQITSTIKHAAQGAAQARDLVAAAKGDAEQGSDVVTKAVDAMGSIEKSSEQIAQIIGMIDEIAFQTNLLALNAGVEAARAGEAGRGFAVVASEVRALAQRSAGAAKEIKALISTSSTQVKQGVDLVAETGKSFKRIAQQVGNISGVIVDIASGAQQQVTALQEVNVAVNQIDQVTQQNAAMAEEATAASHALAHETTDLTRLIGRFQVGEATAAPPMQQHHPRRTAA